MTLYYPSLNPVGPVSLTVLFWLGVLGYVTRGTKFDGPVGQRAALLFSPALMALFAWYMVSMTRLNAEDYVACAALLSFGVLLAVDNYRALSPLHRIAGGIYMFVHGIGLLMLFCGGLSRYAWWPLPLASEEDLPGVLAFGAGAWLISIFVLDRHYRLQYRGRLRM